MRMNFVQDATAKIEGLLEVNQDFCRKQGPEPRGFWGRLRPIETNHGFGSIAVCAKVAADAAAELLEVALTGDFGI